MPIYEYACPDCNHRFETIQKISEDPVKVCPTCGAGNVKKLVSATSFVLKGSGWYSDHYGLKSGAEASASPAASTTPAAPAPAAPAPAPAPAKSSE